MTLKPEAASRKDATGGDATAFQHRHYAFVAKTIAAMPAHAATLRTQRESVASAFATAFEANPRFDRVRFLNACGVVRS